MLLICKHLIGTCIVSDTFTDIVGTARNDITVHMNTLYTKINTLMLEYTKVYFRL